MKKILKLVLFSSLSMMFLASCEKDEIKDYFNGGTPPVLTSSVDALNLNYADADKQALTLNWTNPNYTFTTGVSSQDVSYIIEIDTVGSNFSNPQKQSISVSKDLSRSFVISQFNDYLLNQLVLKPGVEHTLEIRVISSLGNGAGALVSNSLQLTATPYAIPPKVNPPASGELYITGSAVASGWTNAPPKETQQFTKVSETFYEIVVDLIGGNSYTFLPTWGSWNDKYSIKVKNDPNSVNGGDFQWQGEDILAPAASGTYKIEVDFQRGKFAVKPQ